MIGRPKLVGGKAITVDEAIVSELNSTELHFIDFFLLLKSEDSLKLFFPFPPFEELRKTVFGSSSAPPRGEWSRTAIMFGSTKDVSVYQKITYFATSILLHFCRIIHMVCVHRKTQQEVFNLLYRRIL